MSHDSESRDFAHAVLALVPDVPDSGPRVYYNEDGDCLEFLFGNEGYKAERLDKIVTVYHGRDSGHIVGSLIKGIRRFIEEILEDCPGFSVEIQDGRVRLEHLFTAAMWKSGDQVRSVSYKVLRNAAHEANLDVEVPCGAM